MRIFPVFSFLIMTGYATILSAQTSKKNQHISKQQLYQNCTLEYEADNLNDISRYDSLALVCKEKGVYEKAKKYLEKILDIRIEHFGRKHEDVALSYNNLGEICRMLSDYDKAKFYHKKAIKIRQKTFGENSLIVAQSYSNLALIYGAMSDYETAKKYHEKALDIRLNNLGENHIDLANSYGNLAVIYHTTSDYEEAEKYHKKALKIMLDNLGENHLHVAYCYNNLASTYQKLGDYEKAREYFEESLKIRLNKLGENHICLSPIYNNLAVLCHTLGNYETAKNYQEQALEIEKNHLDENHVDIATSYSNLGGIYKSLGNYERAKEYHLKSLKIRQKILGKKHVHVAQSYNNLATVYKALGDYEEAKSHQEEALKIGLYNLDEHHTDIADNYHNLGGIYSGLGNYEKAKSYHRKSLSIRQQKLGKNHLQVAQSYSNLAGVYYTLNDFKTAKRYVKKSLVIRLKKLDKNHIDVITCYSNLAIIYEGMERYPDADSLWNMIIPTSLQQLKNTCLFLPEKQRLNYLKTITPIYNHFYLFASNHGTDRTKQHVADLLLNTKSLALTYSIDTKKIMEAINNDTLNDIFKKLTTINNELGRVELMTNEELKGCEWNLSEKRKIRDSLNYQILKHTKLREKLDTKIAKWQDVQDCLNHNEAVVDFIRIYTKQDSLWTYHAIIIKATANPIFVRLSDERALENYLKHNSDGTPIYLSEGHNSYQLYEKIWQPMEPHLQGITKISISPSGLLHLIAFESLKYNKTSGYLAERFDFHHYSALRDMLKEKTEVSFEDIVLGGHIIYDLGEKEKYQKAEVKLFIRGKKRSGFQRLHWTLDEVVNISKIAQTSGLTHTLLTASAVTEDTVQHFSGDFAPSILHWATHGFILPPLEKTLEHNNPGSRDRIRAADNPLQRSLLAFYGANHRWEKDERTFYSDDEDGILTALEVTALDLQNTDLVVLSACSTGLGNVHNTEGVFGLQRAFKLAGVNHVVASLWDVDDTATKDLMLAFYENLLRKKQNPATALRNAKDELREAGYEAQDWAGFILIE